MILFDFFNDDIEPPEDNMVLLNRNGMVVMNIKTFVESAGKAAEILEEAFRELRKYDDTDQ